MAQMANLNKRIPIQPTMTFDYTTPDLKVVAKPLTPDLRINFAEDLEVLQNKINASLTQTRAAASGLGVISSLADFFQVLEANKKQQDLEVLQNAQQYAVDFDLGEFGKLKTKDGKKYYLQIVASNFLKNLESEVLYKYGTEWKDLDEKTLAQTIEQYYSEKISQAAMNIPEEYRSLFVDQGLIVGSYLKSQWLAKHRQYKLDQYQNLRDSQDVNSILRYVHKAFSSLADDFDAYSQFINQSVYPKLLTGGKLDDELSELLATEKEKLYTAADAYVDNLNVSDEMKETIRGQLYKRIGDYTDALENRLVNTVINADTALAESKVLEDQEAVFNAVFTDPSLGIDLPSLKYTLANLTSAYWNGTIDPDTYSAQLQNFVTAVPAMAEAAYNELRKNELFASVSNRDLRLLIAKRFVDEIGKIAVQYGAPELLSFVDSPDQNGIRLSSVQDEGLQKLISYYKETATQAHDQMIEDLDQTQQTFIENYYNNLGSTLATNAALLGAFKHIPMSQMSDDDIELLANILGEDPEVLKTWTDADKARAINMAVLQMRLQIDNDPYITDLSKKNAMKNYIDDAYKTAWADETDKGTYAYLLEQIMRGQISPQDLITFQDRLSIGDFTYLSSLAGNKYIGQFQSDLSLAMDTIDGYIKTYKSILNTYAPDPGLVSAVEGNLNRIKLMLMNNVTDLIRTGDLNNPDVFANLRANSIVNNFLNLAKANGYDLQGVTQSMLAPITDLGIQMGSQLANVIPYEQIQGSYQLLTQDVTALDKHYKPLAKVKTPDELANSVADLVANGDIFAPLFTPLYSPQALFGVKEGYTNQAGLRDALTQGLNTYLNEKLPSIETDLVNKLVDTPAEALEQQIVSIDEVAQQAKEMLKDSLTPKFWFTASYEKLAKPLYVYYHINEPAEGENYPQIPDEFFTTIAKPLILDAIAEAAIQKYANRPNEIDSPSFNTTIYSFLQAAGFQEDTPEIAGAYTYVQSLVKKKIAERATFGDLMIGGMGMLQVGGGESK